MHIFDILETQQGSVPNAKRKATPLLLLAHDQSGLKRSIEVLRCVSVPNKTIQEDPRL